MILVANDCACVESGSRAGPILPGECLCKDDVCICDCECLECETEYVAEACACGGNCGCSSE